MKTFGITAEISALINEEKKKKFNNQKKKQKLNQSKNKNSTIQFSLHQTFENLPKNQKFSKATIQ